MCFGGLETLIDDTGQLGRVVVSEHFEGSDHPHVAADLRSDVALVELRALLLGEVLACQLEVPLGNLALDVQEIRALGGLRLSLALRSIGGDSAWNRPWGAFAAGE